MRNSAFMVHSVENKQIRIFFSGEKPQKNSSILHFPIQLLSVYKHILIFFFKYENHMRTNYIRIECRSRYIAVDEGMAIIMLEKERT